MEGDRRELAELLHDYETALFTTRDRNGRFHTRPMAVQRRPFEDYLWFATWRDSAKVDELESDPHCGVAFHAGGRSATYVSISGRAEVVQDRQKIHELWEPSWKGWFPDGPDSKDLVLIKVEPEHAEYVHPKTGRLGVLFAAVTRAVSDNERPPVAEKRELDLH
ncbi:pyridoxamine 5'-phosphate oxidase family protein [Vulgatibacter sp.]|uniref:pyridoxamine 5'-phosphate oxidase family protein n=1 Tax=Vulgatibacter sp. TaxID=1971226 RepID=UPI003567F563